VILLLALSGCGSVVGGGGSSDSSSKSCSGEGGLFPSPVAPQGYKPLEKYSVSESVFQKATIMPAGTALTAVVDEECIVKQPANSRFISQSLRADIEAQASRLEGRAYTLKTPGNFSETQLRRFIGEDPCLMQVSEEAEIRLADTTTNDPQLSLLKHLENIDAYSAWDLLHVGLTGAVPIAIIDDGMQMDHPDLSGVIWTNPGETASNGIDDDANGYVDDINGYNFSSNLASPAHENGNTHGTHVAGLAAAEGNNAVGITGVMGRNADIMVLNVFGTNATTNSTKIINAINYARIKGAKVINMSLGGSGTAASVNTAMVNAVAAGTFIASAAGNDSREVTAAGFYMPMGYSKDIEGAMSVGSIDAISSLKSGFSNWSTTYVEIGAPGSNSVTGGLRSTFPTNTYAYLQGTSMASPVLAGAAALVIGWAESNGLSPTPAQVEALIKSSATSSSALTTAFENGGILNLNSMAQAAQCSL